MLVQLSKQGIKPFFPPPTEYILVPCSSNSGLYNGGLKAEAISVVLLESSPLQVKKGAPQPHGMMAADMP